MYVKSRVSPEVRIPFVAGEFQVDISSQMHEQSAQSQEGRHHLNVPGLLLIDGDQPWEYRLTLDPLRWGEDFAMRFMPARKASRTGG